VSWHVGGSFQQQADNPLNKGLQSWQKGHAKSLLDSSVNLAFLPGLMHLSPGQAKRGRIGGLAAEPALAATAFSLFLASQHEQGTREIKAVLHFKGGTQKLVKEMERDRYVSG